MSLFRSLPAAALRQRRTCTDCLRSFSSSTRSSEGADRTPFTALLDTMKPSQNNNRSRASSSPLRARAQNTPARRADRSNPIFGVMAKSVQEHSAANKRKESAADIERATFRQDLERQLTRRWKAGDVYAPHDLSGVEMSKWKQIKPKGRPRKDVLDMLNINPLDHYKNFAMMSEYVTEMGRIKHNRDTGLRPVNQRKMAKAVRRAIGLGLMSSVHRHPEILDLERRRQG